MVNSIITTSVGTLLGMGTALAIWEMYMRWQTKKSKEALQQKLEALFPKGEAAGQQVEFEADFDLTPRGGIKH